MKKNILLMIIFFMSCPVDVKSHSKKYRCGERIYEQITAMKERIEAGQRPDPSIVGVVFMPWLRTRAKEMIAIHDVDGFLSVDEVSSVGLKELLRTYDAYEPEQGSFFNYAYKNVSFQMKEHCYTGGKAVSKRHMDQYIKFKNYSSAFYEKNKRRPTLQEAALALNARADFLNEAIVNVENYFLAKAGQTDELYEAPERSTSGSRRDPYRHVSQKDEQTVIESIEFQELKTAVRNALSELAPHEKEAFELFYFEGLSAMEIADRMKKPYGSIRNILQSKSDRALRTLRVTLKKTYDEMDKD